MFFVYKFSRFVVLGALTFGMLAVGTIQIQAGAQQAAVNAAAKRQAQTAALQASMPTNLTPRAAKPGTSTTPKPAATTDALKKSPGATSVSSSIAPARVQTATPSLPFTGVQGQAGSGSTSTSSARVGQTAVPATPTKPRIFNDTRTKISAVTTKIGTALKPKPGSFFASKPKAVTAGASTPPKEPWYKRQTKTPEQEAAALASRHEKALKTADAKKQALATKQGQQRESLAIKQATAATQALTKARTTATAAALPKRSFRDQLKSLNPMDKIRELKAKRAERSAAKKTSTATPAKVVPTDGTAADGPPLKKGFFRNKDGTINKTRAIGGAALGAGALVGLGVGLAAAFDGSDGESDDAKNAVAMGAPLETGDGSATAEAAATASPTQTAGTAYGDDGGKSPTF